MPSERKGPGDESSADDAPQQDSWFEPARHAPGTAADGLSADDLPVDGLTVDHVPMDGAASNNARANGTDPRSGGRAGEWFLRTGRAGLLPESMTVSSDDEAPLEWRHEAGGAPPWAGDVVQADGEPPPWESGPWPGAGEERPVQTRVAPGEPTGSQHPGSVGPPGGTGRNWQARAALVTGVLPLVVPGIVLGVLGLRQARYSRSGGVSSWVGIALSVVWAIVLGVVVFGSSGPATSGCTVPRAVLAEYGHVARDLSTGNSGITSGTLAADARLAAGKVNAAAANAREVPLRSALAALASDLAQVQTELRASHASTMVQRLPRATRLELKTLRDGLRTDDAALLSSCAG